MSKLSRRLEALASAVNQLNQNSNVAIGNRLKVEVEILKSDPTQNSNAAIGNKLKVEVQILKSDPTLQCWPANNKAGLLVAAGH